VADDDDLILTVSRVDGDNRRPVFATSDREVIAAVVSHLARRLGLSDANVRALRPVPGRSGGDEGVR
jgi:hypothetical protein